MSPLYLLASLLNGALALSTVATSLSSSSFITSRSVSRNATTSANRGNLLTTPITTVFDIGAATIVPVSVVTIYYTTQATVTVYATSCACPATSGNAGQTSVNGVTQAVSASPGGNSNPGSGSVNNVAQGIAQAGSQNAAQNSAQNNAQNTAQNAATNPQSNSGSINGQAAAGNIGSGNVNVYQTLVTYLTVYSVYQTFVTTFLTTVTVGGQPVVQQLTTTSTLTQLITSTVTSTATVTTTALQGTNVVPKYSNSTTSAFEAPITILVSTEALMTSGPSAPVPVSSTSDDRNGGASIDGFGRTTESSSVPATTSAMPTTFPAVPTSTSESTPVVTTSNTAPIFSDHSLQVSETSSGTIFLSGTGEASSSIIQPTVTEDPFFPSSMLALSSSSIATPDETPTPQSTLYMSPSSTYSMATYEGSSTTPSIVEPIPSPPVCSPSGIIYSPSRGYFGYKYSAEFIGLANSYPLTGQTFYVDPVSNKIVDSADDATHLCYGALSSLNRFHRVNCNLCIKQADCLYVDSNNVISTREAYQFTGPTVLTYESEGELEESGDTTFNLIFLPDVSTCTTSTPPAIDATPTVDPTSTVDPTMTLDPTSTIDPTTTIDPTSVAPLCTPGAVLRTADSTFVGSMGPNNIILSYAGFSEDEVGAFFADRQNSLLVNSQSTEDRMCYGQDGSETQLNLIDCDQCLILQARCLTVDSANNVRIDDPSRFLYRSGLEGTELFTLQADTTQNSAAIYRTALQIVLDFSGACEE